MPAKTFGVICTKGGVGKTTTCANIGGILADMGQRVLLIDCDPQQSLSRVFRLSHRAPFALTQLYRAASAEHCISETEFPNLHIVLNDDPKKDEVGTFLRESVYHFHNLGAAINGIRDQYDYVIIDTQGAKGIIQESVVLASDALLSPVQPKVLDSREFIVGTVDVYRKLQPKPGFPSITGRPTPPLRVLINQADNTTASEQVIRNLRKYFDQEADGLITVLNTMIPDLNAYAMATSTGVPVHRYERSRRGPTLAALHIMTQLIHELEPKLSDMTPTITAVEEVSSGQ